MSHMDLNKIFKKKEYFVCEMVKKKKNLIKFKKIRFKSELT